MFEQVSLGHLWSLNLLKARLTNETVNALIKETDASISTGEDWGKNLAGEINVGSETKFTFSNDTEIKNIAHQYLVNEFNFQDLSMDNLQMGDAWTVSQFAGDYNPAHSHGSTLSGIIYLKVPPQIKQKYTTPNKKGVPSLDGCIHFIMGNFHQPSLQNFGPKAIMPEVGDMYLFPSYILHTVYPFSGDGERRCIAFNMDVL